LGLSWPCHSWHGINGVGGASKQKSDSRDGENMTQRAVRFCLHGSTPKIED
jgi:hypothetical protein